MTRLTYESGVNLCEEGDPGDVMLVIEEGEVAVSKHDETGEEVEVAVLGKGDVAAEMSLFSRGPRTADLVAKTPGIPHGRRTPQHRGSHHCQHS